MKTNIPTSKNKMLALIFHILVEIVDALDVYSLRFVNKSSSLVILREEKERERDKEKIGRGVFVSD